MTNIVTTFLPSARCFQTLRCDAMRCKSQHFHELWYRHDWSSGCACHPSSIIGPWRHSFVIQAMYVPAIGNSNCRLLRPVPDNPPPFFISSVQFGDNTYGSTWALLLLFWLVITAARQKRTKVKKGHHHTLLTRLSPSRRNETCSWPRPWIDTTGILQSFTGGNNRLSNGSTHRVPVGS